MCSLFLVRVVELWLVLAPPKFLLFLGGEMLGEHFHAVFGFEFTDETRVPELAGDAKVLTTAHERVAFARLGGGGDTGWVEVFLFATSDGDESSLANKCVLPADDPRADVGLATRGQTPCSRTESFIERSTVLNLRQINHPVRLHFHVKRINRSQEDLRNLLRKRLR